MSKAPGGEYDYELVIIGGGPAGRAAAAVAADTGRTALLIDQGQNIGGPVLRWGLASKALRQAALLAHGARGLHCAVAGWGPGALMSQIIQPTNGTWLTPAPDAVASLAGRARLLDGHRVEVETADGRRLVTTRSVLVAVGSVPARDETFAPDGRCIHDAVSILGVERLPASVLVVGAGVAGVEFATVLAAFGVRVTLVHPRGRPLDALLDAASAVEYAAMLGELGVDLVPDASLLRIDPLDGGVSAELRGGRRLTADAVLLTLGRVGATAGLGLAAAGVGVDQAGFVRVLDRATGRTECPSVFVAGDVAGQPSVAAWSARHGARVAREALGLCNGEPDAPAPIVVYAVPEVAVVTAGGQAAASWGTGAVVGRADYRDQLCARIAGQPTGWLKVAVDPASRRLLGAVAIGDKAAELAHMVSLSMQMGGRLDELLRAVFVAPTHGVLLREAALDAARRIGAR